MATFSHELVGSLGSATAEELSRDYGVLLASCLVVLMTHPTSTTSLREIIARAAVGPLPGVVIFIGMMVFYAGLMALGVYSFWTSHRGQYQLAIRGACYSSIMMRFEQVSTLCVREALSTPELPCIFFIRFLNLLQ
jgi:hypothetical protein